MLTSRSDGTTTQTGLPSTLRHQRLQHPMRRFAERFGRLQPDALGIGVVVIGMNGEGDACLRKKLCRARGLGHLFPS
ncbi:hypothetical protein ACVIDN_004271 [Rhizobium brockwellii]